MSSNHLPTDYSRFIAISRYARWLPEEGRRETWPETVTRYFDYMQGHLQKKHGYALHPELRAELENAVLGLEVMPSMRAVMTAGPALEWSNVCAYNCAYLPIDHPRAFDEAMYVLMNGTGVGYSVESRYVDQLPDVPRKFVQADAPIVVEDSKEGWCQAFRTVVENLYAGITPTWDVSKVRPAGARLKTFGGRASGPEPLVALFEFTVKTFHGAKGRKLRTIEAHDIMCKVADIVVVGGVRRSAMISLSDLGDKRMQLAKSGQWWDLHPERALANNSYVLEGRPDLSTFLGEMKSLYDSRSGERGIFSRKAAVNQALKYGRRDPNHEFATNPCCVTGDTLVLARVWGLAPRNVPIHILIGQEVEIWNGESWATVVPYYTGTHPIINVVFSDGRSIRCTPNHKFVVDDGSPEGVFVEAEDLAVGAKLKAFPMPEPELGAHNVSLKVVSKSWSPTDEPTYCFTEPKTHRGTFNGIVTGQSEIILRPNQFCNLSSVVIRPTDAISNLIRKVRLATILGTFQSTLTDFRYLRPIWQQNTEEERLLGVSLTGILDNPLTNGKTKGLEQRLSLLREEAQIINQMYARAIGIPASTAITCVKPEGTVSQLVDAASGIHPRYSPFYIRTVRADNKDPLTQFLKDQGVPAEPCVLKPDHTTIFSFPVKSPYGVPTRNSLTAIEHLNLWLTYQRSWAEHKPSVTIYYSDDEFPEVQAWVWKHLDEVSGISFLPRDDHVYQQAPYQEVSEAEFRAMQSRMPARIEWERLREYETEDTTTGSQELACTAGSGEGCELVDIG